MARQGYEIIERNYCEKFGEIDIIAAKAGVIHFVEVKSGDGFNPIYAITPAKLSKVIKAAESYMQKKRLTNLYSIDALVAWRGDFELIENITL
ncbi:MAG: YraN family protein [Helicobacteraceae bacterium]|nr:YraN family protein [Helicobacteraceae bacterium]